MRTALVALHVLCSICARADAFEPVTAALAGLVLAGGGWGIWSVCRFVSSFEGCNSRWIHYNQTGLKTDLENKLFGQHIAHRLILEALDEFMSNENPQKPLVFSLHGMSGTGKNFVSSIIANNIYEQGMASKYVHYLSATKQFPQPGKISEYKSWLNVWLKDSALDCQNSMFIFDEVDKMDPGLMDTIKRFLDHWTSAEEVWLRKSIVIFLSNFGGESIKDTTLQLLNAGWNREEIKVEHLESSLILPGFNTGQSAYSRTSLIEKFLIDVYVPFLPLEYKHVVQCVMATMENVGIKPDRIVADKLVQDLVFVPPYDRIFSLNGCKRVQNRLFIYSNQRGGETAN